MVLRTGTTKEAGKKSLQQSEQLKTRWGLGAYNNTKRPSKKKQREDWRTHYGVIKTFLQAVRLQYTLSKVHYHESGKLKKKSTILTRNPTGAARWEEENNTPSDEDWLIAKVIVAQDKVKEVILNFSPFKSPGLNGVYPRLLQCSLDTPLIHLAGIFCASLDLKYILKALRVVKVMFLPKPERINYFISKAH